MDPALLAGVDDDDNEEDTSIAGVYDQDTELDAESNHNSIDPNKDDDNSSKASIHSNGSQISIHSATNETQEHSPSEEDNPSQEQSEPVKKEVHELETQVPVLHQSERVSVPPSNYIPQITEKYP